MERDSWIGRTFGWSGTRADWLALALVFVWLCGLGWIAASSAGWSIGTTLSALIVWCFLFALLARHAVRDLFGPVFFYDLLRVSRSRLTFGLRNFYVLCLGGFLFLMYYDWLYRQSNYSSEVEAQLSLFAGLAALLLTGGFYYLSRNKLFTSVRIVGLVIGLGVTLLLLLDARHTYSSPRYSRGFAPETLPTSVISRFATDFFEAFVVVQWVVLALLTPVYCAGTIAVEKERKTLEFLLATDLRNREIVFGKLAARVLTLVMYVLAGLPLIAFLQLFGGIDPEQLLAATAATLVTVLGLAAVSIWVSATLRRARDAIVLTYLLVVAYGFVSVFLAALTNSTLFGGWWNTPVPGVGLGLHDLCYAFADCNPFWQFIQMERGLSVNAALRDYTIGWAVAITLLLFTAIVRLRSVTIQQAYGPVATTRRARRQAKRTKRDIDPETRNPLVLLLDGSARRPQLTGNPVAWKEVFVDATFRGGCLGRAIGFVILALVFVPLGMIVYFEFFDPRREGRSLTYRWYQFTQEINGWVRVVTGVLGFLMFMAAAIRGAGAFSGEKDRDSWISLISTPLSSAEILWGKWWGCVLSLRRAFFVLLLVWGTGLALGAVKPLMMLVMLPLTMVYVSAFSWVGLYCSMTARNTLVASVRGFFTALFCAGGFWIVLGLCCFLPMNFNRGSGSHRTEEQLMTFWLGFTPPLVYGVFPLGPFDRDDLGPFRDSDYSAGLTGPIVGTFCWVVFNVLMYRICLRKCRQVTNRGMTEPEERAPPVRDGSGNEAST